MTNKLKIIYEDSSLIVCHKPIGVSSQVERGFDLDMISLLKLYFKEKGEAVEDVYPVHRLDKPVEGLIVYGKTQSAGASLSIQFSERKTSKSYLAIVYGTFDSTSSTYTDYICKEAATNRSKLCDASAKQAKRAILHYNVLKCFLIDSTPVTIVDIHLETGRHHQIRVQMAAHEHSIVGDLKYSCNISSGNPIKASLALCSYKLSFIHPVTKKKLSFTTEPENPIFSSFIKPL